jgi:hypothetical protein
MAAAKPEIALSMVLLLVACEPGTDDFSGPSRGGRLTIQLTDAPGELAEAFVKIEKFVLIRSDQESDASGRIELTPLTTGFIELLSLSGGRVINVVEEAEVPNGTFAQLRVVVAEAYVRLKDDRIFATPGAALPAGISPAGELKCPSCAQSGFKVNFTNGGLLVDDNSIVVVDFEVDRSFGHEAGRSGKWIMHPTLRATTRTVALGRITGNVTLAATITIPACGGQANDITIFKPTAATVTDTITGVTAASGLYNIANVAPGTYTLGHVRDITFMNGDSLTITAASSAANVTVAAGDSAKADYQISAAVCH